MMIDRLVLLRMKPGVVRTTIIVLWNLSGIVLMWHLMVQPERVGLLVASVGLFMILTAWFVMSRTPRTVEVSS